MPFIISVPETAIKVLLQFVLETSGEVELGRLDCSSCTQCNWSVGSLMQSLASEGIAIGVFDAVNVVH